MHLEKRIAWRRQNTGNEPYDSLLPSPAKGNPRVAFGDSVQIEDKRTKRREGRLKRCLVKIGTKREFVAQYLCKG